MVVSGPGRDLGTGPWDDPVCPGSQFDSTGGVNVQFKGLFLIALLVSVVEASDPSLGQIKVGDLEFQPQHALAIWGESTASWEKGKRVVSVFLAGNPMSVDGIYEMLVPRDGIRAQVEGDFAILTLNEDGMLNNLYVFFEEGAKNYGFRGGCRAEWSHFGAQKAVGHVWTEEPQSIGDTPVFFDLQLEIPIHRDREPGKPTATDGGPAGAAYLTYVKAMQDGDLVGVARHAPAESAGYYQSIDDYSRDYEIQNLKESAPQSMAVQGGEMFEGFVILHVRGVDEYGDKVEGKVLMKKDGDTWRCEQTDLMTVWE